MFCQSLDFARKRAGFETNLIRVTLTSKNRKQFHLKGEQEADDRRQVQVSDDLKYEGGSACFRLLLPSALPPALDLAALASRMLSR